MSEEGDATMDVVRLFVEDRDDERFEGAFFLDAIGVYTRGRFEEAMFVGFEGLLL